MTTLSLNSSYDLHLDTNGVITTNSGINAYADIIKSRISTLKGELTFYPDEGIDYFNTLFSSYANIQKWKTEVLATVSSLPFVDDINDFTVSFNAEAKQLSYHMVVKTDIGIVTISK